jgi:hypothetical protein
MDGRNLFPFGSESGMIDWYNRVRNLINGTYVVNVKAGAPTVNEIGPDTWAVYRDSSAGTVKLYANLGGVIKSVALA